jgi:hypothetical protein
MVNHAEASQALATNLLAPIGLSPTGSTCLTKLDASFNVRSLSDT